MSKTDYFVKLFEGIVRFRTNASINPQKNRSGRLSYYAFIGYDHEHKPVKRSLGQDKDRAYQILGEINRRIGEGKLSAGANLFEVASDLEIKAAQTKLEAYNATILQAVDFFLKHSRPAAGRIRLSAATKLFVDQLKERNRTPKYIERYEKEILPDLEKALGDPLLIDISQEDAEKFIFGFKQSLNSNSKSDLISKLSTFFNTLADLRYIHRDLNPFANIKKPQVGRHEPCLEDNNRFAPVSDVEHFLRSCIEKKKFQLLAINAAVLFCGLRKEEISRLNWSCIDLKQKVIRLDAKNAKKRRRRACSMLGRSVEWFKIAREGTGGHWPSLTESARNQAERRIKNHLRDLKHSDPSSYIGSSFTFPQNWARHSFGTYSYALYGFETTKEQMGHTRNVDLINSHYKDIVDKTDAQAYFDLVPKDVANAEDQKLKELAEEESNVGQAIKIDNTWVPVMDEATF